MRARALVLLATLTVSACSSSSDAATPSELLTTEAPAVTDTPVDAPAVTAASVVTDPPRDTNTDATPDTAAGATADTSPADTSPSDINPSDTSAGDDGSLTTDRPFDVYTPPSYDGTTAFPLVVLLHGYTSSGNLQEGYFHLQPLADERGFLYVHPDGTVDGRGNQFWNATDACCDLGGVGVDDVAYLGAVIAQVEAEFEVDPKRIFLVGHSNGGFMSYRMACERPDLVAAIASVAGATFADAGDCAPSEPVSVLQIHGTADELILYEGGEILGDRFPSAVQTVTSWAGYDGCATTATPGAGGLDLESTIAGDDTTTLAFPDCPDGRAVELWSIDGGTHVPKLSTTFMADVIDFLFAHPKP